MAFSAVQLCEVSWEELLVCYEKLVYSVIMSTCYATIIYPYRHLFTVSLWFLLLPIHSIRKECSFLPSISVAWLRFLPTNPINRN